MSTVSTAFEKAQAEDRAALVGYLPAGFPDKETAIRAALAMCDAGADVIEVGLPYSDPLMDGPVIADAVYHALKGGTRIADVLDTVTAIADAGTAALVMTYWNPVDKYGPDAFARDLASAGGAGELKAVRARVRDLAADLDTVVNTAHGTEIARAEHRLRLAS